MGFNIALGNAEYCDGNITYGWGFDFNKICSDDDFLIHFWWSKLLQDESFKKKLIERYKSLRKTTLTNARVLSKIDSMSNWLQESQARNFTKWKILNQYVWPNAYVGGNYTNEINYLKSYLTNRMTWMDGNIDKLLTSNSEVPTNTTLPEVFPNPFDADIQFKMNIEPNTINELLVYDAMGSLYQKNQLNQSNSFTLDTQQWKEGFYYFVLLKDGNVIHSFASVKVKNR